MGVITANIVKARSELERPLKRGFETIQLLLRDDRTEVFDAFLDLTARINTWKALAPVDLQKPKHSECAHLPVGFRKLPSPLAIEHVECFEGGIGTKILNSACN